MFNTMNLIDSDAQLRVKATRLFERVLRQQRGFFRRNRSCPLLSLVEQQVDASQQRYLGIQSVPLDAIVGSENRTTDFDADFAPLKEYLEMRWINVAIAYLRGAVLPPVELIQVDGRYFVRDGHHRISVARALDQVTIDAIVMVMR